MTQEQRQGWGGWGGGAKTVCLSVRHYATLQCSKILSLKQDRIFGRSPAGPRVNHCLWLTWTELSSSVSHFTSATFHPPVATENILIMISVIGELGSVNIWTKWECTGHGDTNIVSGSVILYYIILSL